MVDQLIDYTKLELDAWNSLADVEPVDLDKARLAVGLSQAISLKRIADALDRVTAPGGPQALLDGNLENRISNIAYAAGAAFEHGRGPQR